MSFKNALIVMTSNIGSTSIIKGRHHSIGGFFTSEDESSSSYAGMKSLVTEELKGYFRPELLNRIDEIVVFQPLQKAQVSLVFSFLFEKNYGFDLSQLQLVSNDLHTETSKSKLSLQLYIKLLQFTFS